MIIFICTEKDILPDEAMDDEMREEIAYLKAEHEKMMARPRCPVCGEGPHFKSGLCPYINAPDHREYVDSNLL